VNLRDLHQVVLGLLAQGCGDYDVYVLPKLPEDLSGTMARLMVRLGFRLDHVDWAHEDGDRFVVLVAELDDDEDDVPVVDRRVGDCPQWMTGRRDGTQGRGQGDGHGADDPTQQRRGAAW
jgi:hypothetical protein